MKSEDTEMRSLRRVGGLAALTLAFLALAGPAAHASVAIESFTAQLGSAQAGGHPNYMTTFTLSSHQTSPTPCGCNDVEDATAHLPTGFVGNPHATPQCDVAQFAANECPTDSQVGVVLVGFSAAAEVGSFQNQKFVAPLYNMVPPPEQPALLAFKSGGIFGTPTFEDVSARTASDYGLDVEAVSIEHIAPVTGFKQLTWGVPAAPANDGFRFAFKQVPIFVLSLFGGHVDVFCDSNSIPTEDPNAVAELCPVNGYPGSAVGEYSGGPSAAESGPGYPIASNSPETPFLQNPTTCGLTSLSTSLEVLAYDEGTTFAESSWPATTGCDSLTFNPSQSIEPTSEAADSPSGAEFRLTVPQFESPSDPSPSELRAAHVTFPKGFTLAPNVTNGKTTCSEAEAKMGAYASTAEGHCPEASKIGTISVDTPVLPGPLEGAAYLGEPKPGNRFRIFLVFDGFGVHVKLPGTITPDPTTGQIQIDFENLPQAPFETFNAHFFGSERGSLDTPTQCGTYEVSTEFIPWDSSLSSETSRQFFHVDEGPNGGPCPGGSRPFHPGFAAASALASAAAHTSFGLEVTRQDGEQNLAGLSVTTPPGFAATLRGTSYCPEAQIAAAALETHLGTQEQASPSCPASSLIGETVAAAGPGTHPLYLPGKVYLAGPYKGAPLSFVFITPAVSAGYDLGDVVLRAALHVNPETAQVTATSDPLPQVFGGIPLRFRQIFVDLNREGFALNPTNCNPLAIAAQVSGDEGATSRSKTTSRSPTAPACPSSPGSLSGSPAPPGRPATRLSPPPSPPGPVKPTSPAPRSPCPLPSSSITPISTIPAPASSSPKATTPAKNALPARSSASPAPKPLSSPSRSKVPSTSAPPVAPASPTSSPPSTARSTSPSTATSTPSAIPAASAPPSKPSPTPPSPGPSSASTAVTRASSKTPPASAPTPST